MTGLREEAASELLRLAREAALDSNRLALHAVKLVTADGENLTRVLGALRRYGECRHQYGDDEVRAIVDRIEASLSLETRKRLSQGRLDRQRQNLAHKRAIAEFEANHQIEMPPPTKRRRPTAKQKVVRLDTFRQGGAS